MTPFRPLRFFVLVLMLLPPAAALHAQQPAPRQEDGSLSSFQIDSDKPVKIEADKLDIQDAEQTGTFSGNVFVQQGDMTLRTSRLVVHYSGNAVDRGKKEDAGAGGSDAGNQKITRLEARGKVLIRSKDQEATGEWADYDVATRKIKLGGAVVLSQGPNVLRGEELLIDLNTGKSRLTNTAKDGGRVRGLFLPSAVDRQPRAAQ